MTNIDIQSRTLNRPMDDDTIVTLARQGDSHAFSKLWERYHNRLYRLAYKILKNQEDAEDVIQESFLKAYTHLHSFHGRSQISTWLSRIVINGALGLLRKRRPGEVSIDCGFEEDMQWELPDRSEDALSSYLREEQYERLDAAVRRLPATLRGVLELHLADNISVAEIAVASGISLPATKSRLLRARTNLRQYLNVSKESAHRW